MEVRIKSWNGIGDLLFVTPSLRVIKEAYPDCRIVVNTNLPELLDENPFVDQVISDPNVDKYVTDQDGVFLSYPDPKHGIVPQCHHVESDWKILCEHYGLTTERPKLQPEIYLPLPARGDTVRVQQLQKGNWYEKKSWPYFKEFIRRYWLDSIPKVRSVKDLVWIIAESKAVVCIEGGVSHIAKAVGTPAVVIFGGFAHPRWSGYGDQASIVNEKKCSPCYNSLPCINETERICMREIIPDEVHQSLTSLF